MTCRMLAGARLGSGIEREKESKQSIQFCVCMCTVVKREILNCVCMCGGVNRERKILTGVKTQRDRRHFVHICVGH